jgi:long-chain acyl-CoA synthetase
LDSIGKGDVSTISGLFAERVRRSPDKVAYRQHDAIVGWRGYTWREMDAQAARWRTAFAASGLRRGDRVAILHHNSVEWVCFDIAALGLGLVVVPLSLSDSPRTWAEELAETGARLLVAGQRAHWTAMSGQTDHLSKVSRVVYLDNRESRPGRGVNVSDWLPAGTTPTDPAVHAGNLATITYTSGTTGRPKGVMLTQANMLAAALAPLEMIPGYLEDVFLSFLPMAHIFERTTEYYLAIACGGETVFVGAPDNLPEDFATIRPSVIMGVPRIYERLWKGVESSAAGNRFARWLIGRAGTLGRRRENDGLMVRFQHWLLERFVGRKLLRHLGGRVRIAVSGGAPLAAQLATRLRAVGLPLIEGYGLAEAAGPVTGDNLLEYEPGSVGRPFSEMKIRISRDGEIQLKSPSVMSGYWNRPEETAKVLSRDGWLRTGDLGEMRNGRLYVHGRMRDLVVLSTGDKLAPSDIESWLMADPLFAQVMVLGNERPMIVALAVLDIEHWRRFSQEQGLDPSAPNSAVSERALLARIARRLDMMPEYAQVRRIHASLEPWTVEDGLVSVALKIRRAEVEKRFGSEIEHLYAGHE